MKVCSGLYAAYLLQLQGISDYVLFDAHERLGGKVLSVGLASTGEAAPDQTNRFDLGPSLF
ncbi:NAD(P)/FAD-dependent oxidoreductase [Pseudomonas sp. P7]|uniref:NAD(P)-binding protein n=1 Tax=Pseudomonas sivasensis TaxID=1880678 RepID=UPI0015EB8F9E|nr:NAD(P)/FAD-dependent oxidoreductase [Pseudomonas sivasensis]MCK6191145.1 NAD(P)/FAD-dependent oxidoreductase [Pseudomonas sp. EYE_354]